MSLQQNLVKMLAPDDGVAEVATAEVLAANTQRGYLLIINVSDETIALGLGGNPAVLGKGVVLPPQGAFEMLNGKNLSADAVEAISTTGGKAISIQEGDLVAS